MSTIGVFLGVCENTGNWKKVNRLLYIEIQSLSKYMYIVEPKKSADNYWKEAQMMKLS